MNQKEIFNELKKKDLKPRSENSKCSEIYNFEQYFFNQLENNPIFKDDLNLIKDFVKLKEDLIERKNNNSHFKHYKNIGSLSKGFCLLDEEIVLFKTILESIDKKMKSLKNQDSNLESLINKIVKMGQTSTLGGKIYCFTIQEKGKNNRRLKEPKMINHAVDVGFFSHDSSIYPMIYSNVLDCLGFESLIDFGRMD